MTLTKTLSLAEGKATRPATPATTRPVDESEAWNAVESRDGGYDGVFVYGVRTTGVYCRPSCPSRRPRRENVRFYGSPDAADAGGFRACKRCQPRPAGGTGPPAAVARALAHLDTHLDEPVPLDALAAVAGLSRFHLQRTFKQVVGLSPKQYHDARRLERLKTQLGKGDTVSRATFEAGFGSSRAVYEKADAALGMSPAAYRRGGAGVRIRYAVARTRLGWLLVAATERGVCSVSFAEQRGAARGGPRARVPQCRDQAR